jgi:flagellar hook assembly protein FlgD
MMQAESLNQLTLLNRAIKDLQTMQQTSYASSLLGKTVSGIADGGTALSGTVQAVKIDAGGPLLELSTGHKLRLLDVTQVGTG